MSIKPYLLILAALLMQNCSSEEGPANFNETQILRLLAGDSSKTWILTNRTLGTALQDCETDDQFIFSQMTPTVDTTTVNFETGAMRCTGQADSIVFQGSWAIIDGLLVDSLALMVFGDTTKRSLDFISAQILALTFLENGQLVAETYSHQP